MMSTPKFLRVGLTGSIGSGKSLSLKYFQENQWKTISCDTLVHNCLEHDEAVKQTLTEIFGESIFDEQKRLIKRKMAKLMFENLGLRQAAEAYLHPIVRELWQNSIMQEPLNHWVIEIPLLFEKNLEKSFDFVVCVGCGYNIQHQRLLNRGWNETDISQRLQAQLSLSEKISRAHTVFWNDGTPTWLQSQIHRWIHSVAPHSLL
jgi:dephospho-CoA kinase